MAKPLRSLVVVAALTGSMYIVMDAQHKQQLSALPSPSVIVPKETPKVVVVPKLQTPVTKKERAAKKTKEKRKNVKVSSLPSCAAVKRQYDRMSVAERWTRWQSKRDSPAQVAHGRQCLGL